MDRRRAASTRRPPLRSPALRLPGRRCAVLTLRNLPVFLLLWAWPARVWASDPGGHKQARYLMGTVCEITVYAAQGEAETAQEAAFAELKRIDSLLSNWKEDSALMRMNRAAAAVTGNSIRPEVSIGDELFARLQVALNMARETGGLFDPTVGPLVRAWGFLPGKHSGQAREALIKEAKQRVGWRKIRLDEARHTVRFEIPGMEIDLGGIAKGYAAGRAAQVLRRRGITSAFINLGGSSMVAIGSPPGRKAWPVMIRDPRDGETPAAGLELHDGEAVATSGTYEKTVGEGKQRRSHILNPVTGEALGGATSVTIVEEDAETADALTKAFFFLAWPPAEDWARLLERHPKASVILMAARGEELVCRRGGAHPERFSGCRTPPHDAMLQKRIDDQPTISREMVREAQDIFHRHLKRVGLKHTEQRDTILRTFLETREHLSTDELHRLVKKKDPRIGFTTVYRTLKLLSECGLASEVAFHDGIARFEHQYNRRSHHHMVCTECGSSVEFFSPEVDKLEQEIGRKHHYLTTRHTFQIYGVCEECRKKTNSRRLV